MKKLCVGLNQAIKLLYGITVMVILYLILFRASFIEYGFKTYFLHNQWLYLIFAIAIWSVILVVINIMSRYISRFVSENFIRLINRSVFFMSIIFAILLMHIVYNYYFHTGWDSEVLINTAKVLASGDSVNGEYENWYFSSFPNNVLLVDLFALIIKLGYKIGIQDAVLSICFVQCIGVAITGYLLYRTIESFSENISVAIQGWILYLMTIGVSPWVIIPYSDSVGLLFPIMILYIYVSLKSEKYTYIKSFLFGFIAWTGYKIKPQLFIVFIAVIIVSLLEMLQKRKQATKIAKTLGISVCGMLVSMILICGIAKMIPIERNPQNSFGASHFIMMGLNNENNGGYSQTDVEYTSTQDIAHRSVANWEMIKKRINDYGAKGVLKHLEKKMLSNYSDGTWAWGREGNFYKQCLPDKNTTISPLLKSIYYQNGKRYHYYQAYAQSMWLLILFGCFCSFFKVMREKESSSTIIILLLVFLGLTIFELLFEARARYLFSNVPLYIILANWGLPSHSIRKY